MKVLLVIERYGMFGVPSNGASQRNTMFAKALAQLGHVDVCSFSEDEIVPDIDDCDVVYSNPIQDESNRFVRYIRPFICLFFSPANLNENSLDNFYTGNKENVWHLIGKPNFEIVHHDVFLSYRAEIDEIYNQICPSSPMYYLNDPVQTTKTSIFDAYYMLDLARITKCKIPQTVFI